MEEIRCGACHRKLGEGLYTALSIKCPRCGVLNQLKKAGSLKPERPGASSMRAHDDSLPDPMPKNRPRHHLSR